jgi:hypothetical protein
MESRTNWCVITDFIVLQDILSNKQSLQFLTISQSK